MKKQAFIFIFFVTLPFYVHCSEFQSKNITIIGTGYVGLITGAGLAELGHRVICADIDQEKINKLSHGVMPIYEPGLEKLVKKNTDKKLLFFSSNVGDAIEQSEIIIIAVGTPMGDGGQANLSALNAVLKTISIHLNGYKIICIKSTVPVGTNEYAKSTIASLARHNNFDVVSNPEFLRAGCAIKDFFERTPVVLGSDSKDALEIISGMYNSLVEFGADLITTNFATAELIKYAWNCFSATRICYVNEMANFCNAAGADIQTLVKGISFSDKLLPSRCLRPGPGIGGSCLPKDTQAAVVIAEQYGVELGIIKSVIESNKRQKIKLFEQTKKLLGGSVQRKTVAVLGLSFKPNTDDIRYSSAIEVVKNLLSEGACVKCYDPCAMKNMKKIIPDAAYCQSIEEAVSGADALVLLTDWQEFKDISLDDIALLMNQRIIVDGRNMWSPAELKRLDFKYVNRGRSF